MLFEIDRSLCYLVYAKLVQPRLGCVVKSDSMDYGSIGLLCDGRPSNCTLPNNARNVATGTSPTAVTHIGGTDALTLVVAPKCTALGCRAPLADEGSMNRDTDAKPSENTHWAGAPSAVWPFI